MEITFMGAARCVTGSCTMIETAGKKLLVDCGLRQGRDAKAVPVTDGFTFDPKEIDAVRMTTAFMVVLGAYPPTWAPNPAITVEPSDGAAVVVWASCVRAFGTDLGDFESGDRV